MGYLNLFPIVCLILKKINIIFNIISKIFELIYPVCKTWLRLFLHEPTKHSDQYLNGSVVSSKNFKIFSKLLKYDQIKNLPTYNIPAQKPTSPSLWWAGGNRRIVWITEEGSRYGLDISTALKITWESESLREITLKENPGRWNLWAGWMQSSMGRITQKENPIKQCVGLV